MSRVKNLIRVDGKNIKSQPLKNIPDFYIQQLNLICFLCAQNYNCSDHAPKIICRQQHTYCYACVKNLFSKGQVNCSKCPECRSLIYENQVFNNRSLMEILEKIPSMNQQSYQLQLEKQAFLEKIENLEKQNLKMKEKVYSQENQKQVKQVLQKENCLKIETIRGTARKISQYSKKNEKNIFKLRSASIKSKKQEIFALPKPFTDICNKRNA